MGPGNPFGPRSPGGPGGPLMPVPPIASSPGGPYKYHRIKELVLSQTFSRDAITFYHAALLEAASRHSLQIR